MGIYFDYIQHEKTYVESTERLRALCLKDKQSKMYHLQVALSA